MREVLREVPHEPIDDAVGMALTLMPHIAAKATVSDPFLLPRDNEGKPACASGRRGSGGVLSAFRRHCGAASRYGPILARLVRSQSACYARQEPRVRLRFSLFLAASTFTPPFTGFPRHA
jgi:hypothetical protein